MHSIYVVQGNEPVRNVLDDVYQTVKALSIPIGEEILIVYEYNQGCYTCTEEIPSFLKSCRPD